MKALQRVRAAVRIAATIALFWIVALTVCEFLAVYLLDDLPLSVTLAWLRQLFPDLVGLSLSLGAAYATALFVFRPGGRTPLLSAGRTAAIGTLSAIAVFAGWSSGSPVTASGLRGLLEPIVVFAAAGALTGFGIWRVYQRGRLPPPESTTPDMITS